MNVRRNLMNEKRKTNKKPNPPSTTKTAGKPSGVLFPPDTQKNSQRRETHVSTMGQLQSF